MSVPASERWSVGERFTACAAALGGGVWMTLGRNLSQANSDSLLPVFGSLYRWTPFIWGEDRFGQAVALLALPFRNPVHNLLAQSTVDYALFLATWLLLARLLLGARGSLAAGVLSATAAVVFFGPFHVFFCACQQAYTQSAAPALAALVCLDASRPASRRLGWVLVAAALWITPTTLFWLAPLAVAVAERRGSFGRPLIGRIAGLTALAAAVAWAGRAVPRVRHTPGGWSPLGDWPGTWNTLLAQAADALPFAYLVIVAAGVGAWALLGATRRAASPVERARRLATRLVGAAALSFLLVGAFDWVRQNAGIGFQGWRYATISFALVAVAPVVAAAGLWASPSRRAEGLVTAGALVVLCLVLTMEFALPSLARAKQALRFSSQLDRPLDGIAKELIRRHATHLAGDYWQVYPIVFRANSLLYRAGSEHVIWPIADRAISARELWWRDDWGTARIAVVRDDPWLGSVLEELGLPELELVKRGRKVDIWRGRAPSLPPSSTPP